MSKHKKTSKPNYTDGYHWSTSCSKDNDITIETHIHGQLKVKRDSKSGKVEHISMISRGRD